MPAAIVAPAVKAETSDVAAYSVMGWMYDLGIGYQSGPPALAP